MRYCSCHSSMKIHIFSPPCNILPLYIKRPHRKYMAVIVNLLCLYIKWSLPSRHSVISSIYQSSSQKICGRNRLIYCAFTGSGLCACSLSTCQPVLLLLFEFVCLSVCMFVCLSVCFSICLPVRLSVCLSICLSVCLFACLSVCLSGCLSACQSFYLSALLIRVPSSELYCFFRHLHNNKLKRLTNTVFTGLRSLTTLYKVNYLLVFVTALIVVPLVPGYRVLYITLDTTANQGVE